MKAIKNWSFLFALLSIWACGGSDDGDPGTGGDNTPPSIEIPTGGPTSPTSYDGMTLVFEENFDGASLNTNN